jgi:hypothetical protein
MDAKSMLNILILLLAGFGTLCLTIISLIFAMWFAENKK